MFQHGMATLPAGEARAQCRAPAFDDAIFYLDMGFTLASIAMRHAAQADQAALFRRINAYAHAMTILPAAAPHAIDAKVRAARWSIDQGAYALSLDGDLAAALIASADRDRAGQG